jgi:hypothetical protein
MSRLRATDVRLGFVKNGYRANGGEGGILTPSYRLSQHVFSNMRENRINTDDFYGLAFCNSFNCSA